MAHIEWEDDDGTGTLTSTYPAGGIASQQSRRLRNWTPKPVIIGPSRIGLGSGRRFQFKHRTDRLASFDIVGIKPTQFALWERFYLHAMNGCAFYVYTTDAAARVYECLLAPDTEPKLELTDARLLEYTLSVVVKNLENAPMLCDYTSTGA